MDLINKISLDEKPIIFLTNFRGPHLMPLWDHLYKIIGKKFMVMECVPMSSERIAMGYESVGNRDYLISYNQISDSKIVHEIIDEASIVLFSLGSVKEGLIYDRILNGKPVIFLSERLFKRGKLKLLDPRFWIRVMKIRKWNNANIWLLTLGFYAQFDFEKIGFRKDRIRVFGYMLDIDNQSLKSLMLSKQSNVVSIIWIGRLIDWKRPFDLVTLAHNLTLCNLKVPWRIDIIGDGPLHGLLRSEIVKKNLQDKITLLGFYSQEKIMVKLRQSDIMLMTSNQREGWGAVVNEAMARACAIVATYESGGAKQMINDGYNGRLFQAGNTHALSAIVAALIDNREEREMIGANAYYSIKKCWNAEVAAYNLVRWINSDFIWTSREGPVSKPV